MYWWQFGGIVSGEGKGWCLVVRDFAVKHYGMISFEGPKVDVGKAIVGGADRNQWHIYCRIRLTP